MSIGETTNVSKPASQGFFAKHEVNMYTAMAVGSLALALISLGVIVAAMGTSPTWYHVHNDGAMHKYFYDDPTDPTSRFIPEEISFRSDIENTMQYGAQVGGVALGTCVTGVALFIVALVMRHRAMKKQIEKNKDPSEVGDLKTVTEVAADASSKRWKSILFIVGLSVGTFSAGMMIGSSLILDHGVGHMQDLIQQGRTDFPHAMTYTKEWHREWYNSPQDGYTYYDYFNLVPSKQSFWDAIQSDWVDPTKSAMSGMLPVGVFGALGGGGLTAVAIFGRGIFSCYSHCKKTKAEETSS